MSDKRVVVKFIKAWRGYSAGESAGFDAAQAEALVDGGVAGLVKKVGVAASSGKGKGGGSAKGGGSGASQKVDDAPPAGDVDDDPSPPDANDAPPADGDEPKP